MTARDAPFTPPTAPEAGVLARYLGQVQQRCSLLAAELRQRIAALEHDKAQLQAMLHQRDAEIRQLREQLGQREADELICRTGCLTLEHQWRDGDNHCRLDGRPCLHAGRKLPVDLEEK